MRPREPHTRRLTRCPLTSPHPATRFPHTTHSNPRSRHWAYHPAWLQVPPHSDRRPRVPAHSRKIKVSLVPLKCPGYVAFGERQRQLDLGCLSRQRVHMTRSRLWSPPLAVPVHGKPRIGQRQAAPSSQDAGPDITDDCFCICLESKDRICHPLTAHANRSGGGSWWYVRTQDDERLLYLAKFCVLHSRVVCWQFARVLLPCPVQGLKLRNCRDREVGQV